MHAKRKFLCGSLIIITDYDIMINIRLCSRSKMRKFNVQFIMVVSF